MMTPFYIHGFSSENQHEILGESDKKLIQKMYGEGRSVEVRAIYHSKKAKVMLRKIVKNSKPEKVKTVFTLKPKHFSETTENSDNTNSISEQSFKKLLDKLKHINMEHFLRESFGVW